MRRKRGIQTQFALILIVALILLATALQIVHVVQQRDTLVQSNRELGLSMADSLKELVNAFSSVLTTMPIMSEADQPAEAATYMPYMIQQMSKGFSNFVKNKPDIAFETIAASNGVIMMHSDTAYARQTLEDLNLQDLPLNRTVRRDIPGYGATYLTAVPLENISLVPQIQLQFILGTYAEPIDSKIQQGILSAIAVALGAIGIVTLAGIYLIRRSVADPVQAAQTAIHQFGQGRLDVRLKPQGSAELRDLALALNEMATDLQSSHETANALFHAVETRVQEHVRDIEIAAEIGRITTSLRDLDALLRETVEQIRQRYDMIYHAQIFLLDDLGEYAVLVESTGEAGQRLLELGHKLPVGSNSVIGRVTARGEIVIASDTQVTDVPWQPNPLLPDTRAEMALPLLIEERVIGALDVQSFDPDVFSPEIQQVLTVLSDQVAIAIENARLLSETNRRIREIDMLNRQLTRAAWNEVVEEEQTPQGYLYDHMQAVPLTEDTIIASRRGEAAIQVRDETIGTLIAELPDNADLSEDDQELIQAVADRVALAIENARLFQQTQRALAETARLYEAARAVNTMSDLAAIYQLITEELSAIPHIQHVEILLSGPDPSLVQYLESVYSWNRRDSLTHPATGERLPVVAPSYAGDPSLPVTTPEIIPNLERNLSRTHPLFNKLSALNARSALLAPLNAGGQWFGLLICCSARASGFRPAYITFTSALADQLALAIENRRLFDEAQTEARRARALAEAGQLASQIGGNYESGLQSLFQAVAGPGQYDRWWFGLVSADETTLNRVAAADPDTAETINIKQAANALAEAARIGELVLVNDPTDHPVVGDQPGELLAAWGKHMAMPVKIGTELVGVLQIGRGMEEPNLDERDIQLVATLSSQIAVVTENQRLFDQTESQRQNLQTIVDTMPTGILVMDRQGRVVLSNQNLRKLLGPDLQTGTNNRPSPYPMIRSGTDDPYPRADWPLSRVFATGEPAVADDITVVQPEGRRVNIFAQAVPIFNAAGEVVSVVGAFQDITDLQELERALQDSLRETTLLYEASRSISRATTMDEVTQVVLWQIGTLEPDQAYIFLREDAGQIARAAVWPITEESSDACDITLFEPLFTDEPLIIQNATVSEQLAPCLNDIQLAVVGSFPLKIRDQINGWIVIGYASERDFTTEQRRFMITLADQTAVTIENQRLFVRTQNALSSTAILYHASRDVANSKSPAAILQTFIEYAAPSNVSQALLYYVLSEVWDTPYAAVEVGANWEINPIGDLAGLRYPAAEFPYWDMLAEPDVVWIDNIATATLTDAQFHAFTAFGLESGVLVPLRGPDRPLGIIIIGMPSPWVHDEDDAMIFRALADQASISLQNIQLYDQAQQRARRLSTAAEISRAATSILQLDELLPQVVDLIYESFGYDHVQVFLISSDSAHANLVASTGEAGRQLLAIRHSLPVGSKSVIGQVTLTGRPQIALDTADARVIHRPNPYLPDTRSEMALPLIGRGQIIGALDVQSNQAGAFTDEDTRMLASLADMLATAIENARLFEVSQRRAEEMAFLFNVTTAATLSPDLDQSLAQVVETLRGMMNVTSASVFLVDDTGQYMIKGADTGNTGQETENSTLDIDRGLVGWVARHNEAVIIDDLSQDPRRLPTSEKSTRSVMAVPLQTSGNRVGVVVVEGDQIAAFNQDNLRLLQTLSGSLAAIIQNSRLLREVQDANERLLEIDRLKTNFLAAMSHELRTPLNSIIGFSRVILKGIDGPLTDMQEQDLNTIYDSGKHLLGLVNDILDQAKIEAGKMDLSFGYFKLQDVIKGVMSSAVGLTRDKPIRLHTEIAEDLPDAYGDEFRTRQILLNLISNASKFTEEGSITVSAFPVFDDEHQFIQISVADTGIGIAEKDMHLLFEAFQQVDNSTTRTVEGTGMGLPLAKSLTELQGGRIWVLSEPGIGSTFSVTIPVEPMPDEPEDEDQEATQPETDVPAMPVTKTVLVAESSIEIINLYRRYLSHAGYDVIGTTQPADIEELIIVHRPCVFLLDVNLRDGDGWRVLEHLQDTGITLETPVIVCSINPNSEQGFQFGAAAYLIKPFSEDQLVDTVRRVEAEAARQRILFIDDRPESIRLFRETLEASQQYTVLEATSGQDALDLIHHLRRIDLVILDLRMPEIDGFDVLQNLRADDRTAQIPVLVLTAEDVNADERALLDTIDIYRKDDINEQHLLSQVESQLSREKNGN